MTKEELKQEAEEKAGIYFDSLDYDHGNVSDTPFSAYDVFVAYEKGALDFAEPREKRIADLEQENTLLKENKTNVFADLNEETAQSIAMLIDMVADLKELIKTLIENRPDTYSGIDIAMQQIKMFRFQNAVNKARQFLKECE